MDKLPNQFKDPIHKKVNFVESITEYDKYYLDYEVVDDVVPQENGKYLIKKKVIVHKKLIADVVQADADSVGVESFLRNLSLSGQAVPDVAVSDQIADFTPFPDNAVDALNYTDKALASFNKLPKELTKGMTFEQFMSSDVNKLFNDYVSTLKPVEKVKGGDDNGKPEAI